MGYLISRATQIFHVVVDPGAGGRAYGYDDLMPFLLPIPQPRFLKSGQLGFLWGAFSFVKFVFDEQHAEVAGIETVGYASRQAIRDLPRVRTRGTYSAVDFGDEPGLGH